MSANPPPEPPRSAIRRAFDDVAAESPTLLKAAATAITPWVQYYFNLPLVSEYYSAAYASVASLLMAISMLLTVAWNHTASQESLRYRLAYIWIPLLVGTLIACIALHQNVGVTFDPGRSFTWLFTLLWFVAYQGVFVATTVVVVLLLLLYRHR